MAGLVKNRGVEYQRIPQPGGQTAQQASTVYNWGTAEYPELPMPATQFVTSTAALKSQDVVPTVLPNGHNTTVVKRNDRMNGYIASSGRIQYETEIPPMYSSPYSSKYQPNLIGPHPNYILNGCLYRCGYPAASVMNGGLHNLALSTKVSQLTTRQSGGPGPAVMTPYPRFSSVQKVPRYSTMPSSYNTQGAPG